MHEKGIARKWSGNGDEAEECLKSSVHTRISTGEGQIRAGTVLGMPGVLDQVLDDETFCPNMARKTSKAPVSK